MILISPWDDENLVLAISSPSLSRRRLGGGWDFSKSNIPTSPQSLCTPSFIRRGSRIHRYFRVRGTMHFVQILNPCLRVSVVFFLANLASGRLISLFFLGLAGYFDLYLISNNCAASFQRFVPSNTIILAIDC